MKNEPIVTTHDKSVFHHCHRHLSWSGVIAGALVAIGLTFLFNILTTGLGLSLYTKNDQGMQALTVAGLIWLILGVYFIFFFAGWVAGKVAARNLTCDGYHGRHCGGGFIHGFLTWTLYLILSLLILSHIGEATSLRFFRSSFTSVGSDMDTTTTTKIESNVGANAKSGEAVIERSSKAIDSNIMTKDIHQLGWVTLTTFFIFALGALGACIGACCAISHCKKKYEEESEAYRDTGYPKGHPR